MLDSVQYSESQASGLSSQDQVKLKHLEQLNGLVAMVSTSCAGQLKFKSQWSDFSDLKLGVLKATPYNIWCDIVSAGTVWPGFSILRLGEIGRSIYNLAMLGGQTNSKIIKDQPHVCSRQIKFMSLLCSEDLREHLKGISKQLMQQKQQQEQKVASSSSDSSDSDSSDSDSSDSSDSGSSDSSDSGKIFHC